MGFFSAIKDKFRKKDERELEWEVLLEKTNICHLVMEHVGAGVTVIDREMKVLAANKKMHEWFPTANFSSRPLCYAAFNVPPKNSVCTFCPTIKTLADGLEHEAITETSSTDGSRNFRIISSPIKSRSGEVVAAILLVEDVTDSHALEKTQKLLSAVVDGAEEAIISKDLEGKILSWNKAAERLYGYSASEMLGRNVSTIIPESMAKDFHKILDKIRYGESVTSFDTERLRKDASRISVVLSVFPLKNADGTIYGAASIAHDVSKQKELEKELRGKIEDLERLHKLTIDREKRIIELKERIRELERA